MGLDIMGQGPDEMLGLTTTGPEKDSISPVDMAKDLIFGQELFRIGLFPLLYFHLDSMGPFPSSPSFQDQGGNLISLF